MGAAVGGVDVVGKAEKQLVEAVVVLHGHLGNGAVGLPLDIDDLGMQYRQVPLFVQVLHKAADAALVAHALAAGFGVFLGGALIGEGDAHAGIEEGFLPQTLEQGLVVVDRGLGEHEGVGLEGDGGAGGGGGTDLFQIAVGLSPGKLLFILKAVPAHPDDEPLGQGVDDGSAHAVQAAGHLVAGILAAELAAGVEHGVDDGDGGNAHFGLDVHRDAAAVVADFNDVALLDGDLDVGAVSGQSLVDGVIHDLIDQMMQAPGAGGTDIHARALAHRLQTLQDLDLGAAVLVIGHGLAVGFGNDLICHLAAILPFKKPVFPVSVRKSHGFRSSLYSGWKRPFLRA